MGRQERNELRNHLIVLMVHLLKWRLQPDRRGRSWALTIAEQRREAERVLAENPSLKPGVDDLLSSSYRTARLRAARQARVSIKAFPDEIPFGWNAMMSEPELTDL